MFGWMFGRRLGELDRGTATVVAVYDGDTCTCSRPYGKPFQVRLYGIDAPELREDYGETARHHLALLIHNRRVVLEPTEHDRYGRVVARVIVGRIDASVAMLQAGHAFHFRRYDSSPDLLKAEATARRRRFGVWAMPWAEGRRLEHERSADGAGKAPPRVVSGCLGQAVACALVGVVAVGIVRGCGSDRPRAPVDPPAAAPPAIPPQRPAAPPPLAAPAIEQRPVAPAPVAPPDEAAAEPAPPAAVDPVDAARWRTWKSADGKFTLHAKFVQATNGRMTLLREDGKRIVVDLDRLCDEDVDFVRKQKWLQAGRKRSGK